MDVLCTIEAIFYTAYLGWVQNVVCQEPRAGPGHSYFSGVSDEL